MRFKCVLKWMEFCSLNESFSHRPFFCSDFLLVENLRLNTFVVSWAVWMCPLTLAWQPSLWINSSVPFWHSERFKNDPKWPPSVRQHVEGTERYKFNEFWPHGTDKGWIFAFYSTITAMIKITIVDTVKMTIPWWLPYDRMNDISRTMQLKDDLLAKWRSYINVAERSKRIVLFRRSNNDAFSSLYWRWIKFWPIGHSATLSFSL